MVTPSETDLREMLERRAGDFVMVADPLEAIVRRASRRRLRNLVLASVTALAVTTLVGLAASLPGGSDGTLDSRSDGRLRLVDYSVRTPGPESDHPHANPGPTITLDDVRRHGRCMRSQGFELPAPTKQPGGGWAVILNSAKAVHFGSRKFREAWFVTCGPLGGPLSGDLVVGGPRPKVDRFRSCMSRQGFDLPRPTRERSGHYDTAEWQFDLTSIDTSTSAWNRAMFVTCAPDGL
jgi:hypothetical protein